jgi:glyoxylase-like metal-dependent hydrolase (beta-lactamase superfamily II)
MSPELRLSLGISGYSHADPRLVGMPAIPGNRLAFPAGWALIEHPRHGAVLFDCGYGAPARTAMRRGLRRIYRSVVGVCCSEHDDAARLLAARGLSPADISTVVVSHFHPDHVGGLRDFDHARFIAHADAWRQVRRAWPARLHAQVWRDLLPADFAARLDVLEPRDALALDGDLAAFGHGHDLFGDGSVVAIALPGHAAGQVGIALRVDGARVLLVGDAFWRREQLDAVRPLPWPTRWLATDDAVAYRATLQRLRDFRAAHPGAWLIPAHCAATIEDWEFHHPGTVLRAAPMPDG